MESADLQSVHRALVQQWDIAPVGEERVDWDALLDALGRRVEFLLKHDLERLMTAMYQIDVSEERFSEAVQRPQKDRPARAIAELILEREIEKMESRKRYARAEDPGDRIPIEDQPTTKHDSPDS